MEGKIVDNEASKVFKRPVYGRVGPVDKARKVERGRFERPRASEGQFKGRLQVLSERKKEEAVKKAKMLQDTGFFNVKSADEYEKKYQGLSEDVKKVVLKPEVVRTMQEDKKKEELSRIEDEIEKNLINLKYEREVYERRKKNIDKRWKQYKERYEKGKISKEMYLRRKEGLKRREKELDVKYAEKKAYYETFNDSLEKFKNKIAQGENFNAKDVLNVSMEEAKRKNLMLKERHKRVMSEYKRNLMIEKLTGLGYHRQVSITPLKSRGRARTVVSYYDPVTRKSVRVRSSIVDFDRYKTVYKYKDDKGKEKLTIEVKHDMNDQRLKVNNKWARGQYWNYPVEPYQVYDYAKKKKVNVYYDTITGKIVTDDGKTVEEAVKGVERDDEQKRKDEQKVREYIDNITGGLLTKLEEGKIVERGGTKEEEGMKQKEKEGKPVIVEPLIGEQLKMFKELAKKGYEKTIGKLRYEPEKFPFIKVGGSEERTMAEKGADYLVDYYSKEQEKLIQEKVIGKDEYETFTKRLDEYTMKKYQPKVQEMFEEKYKKRIDEGEITFDEAQKRFVESEEYKKMMNEAEKEYKVLYGEGYKNLQKKRNFTEKIKVVPEYLWLEAKKGVSKSIRSPGATAKTAASLYLLPKLYKTLPTVVQTGVEVGSLGYGGYMVKKGTLPEMATGTLLIGLSTAALASKGVKLAGKPVVKYKKVKNPRIKLSTRQRIFLEDKKKGVIMYPRQKVAQYGVPGRRTEVTTNWRKWANVGYQKITRKKNAELFGKVYKGEEWDRRGYNKAMKLLRRYGVGESKAKRILSTIKPKEYDVYEGGMLRIGAGKGYHNAGKKSVKGYFVREQRPVKMYADKDYLIKTKGGRSQYDLAVVERTPVKYSDKVMKEVKDVISFKQGTRGNVKVLNVKDLNKMLNTLGFGKVGNVKVEGYKKSLIFAGEVERSMPVYKYAGKLYHDGKEARLITREGEARLLKSIGYEARLADVRFGRKGKVMFGKTGLGKPRTEAIGFKSDMGGVDGEVRIEKYGPRIDKKVVEEVVRLRRGQGFDYKKFAERVKQSKKVDIVNIFDIDSGESYYGVKDKTVYVNWRDPWYTVRNRKEIILHETTHAVDKYIANDKVSNLKKVLRLKQTIKDYRKLGGRKWDMDYLRYVYDKGELPEEALAKFAAKYPNEIVRPTTKTGDVLNKMYSGKGIVARDEGYRQVQNILNNKFIAAGGGTIGKGKMGSVPKLMKGPVSFNVESGRLAGGYAAKTAEFNVKGVIGSLSFVERDKGKDVRRKEDVKILPKNVFAVEAVKSVKEDSAMKAGIRFKQTTKNVGQQITRNVEPPAENVAAEIQPPMVGRTRTGYESRAVRPRKVKFYDQLRMKKKTGKEKKKKTEFYALFPDFTARAVGIKVGDVTEKEGEKMARRIVTGAEVRPMVEIKK